MSTPKPRGRPARRKSDDTASSIDQDVTVPTQIPAPATPRYTTLATPSALLRSVTRRTPRAAPVTPFGLRAIQRRGANTPGRDRRRSTRGPQRETAFDLLKNLGRALAPVSKPIQSSPQDERSSTPDVSSPVEDETLVLDNEPLPERPRLSLPIDESGTSEDGSSDLRPPRMSVAFDDDDITQHSIEYARRDISIKDQERRRMTFGSDNFEDLTRLDVFSEAGDLTALQQGSDNVVEDSPLGQADFGGGDTEDLGRFSLDFTFPTPPPAVEAEALPNEEDNFMLDVDQPDVGLASSSPNGEAGDFGGVSTNMPEQVSEPGTPGVVGGGLRDEPLARSRKQKKLSRHGIPVPNLPSGVVKRLAMRFARAGAVKKAKISKETLAAVEQASEWFFEQASEDLSTYAKHAGRRTIDESDVLTLMRRQRLVNNTNSVFSLAQRHLPKELLQDMRLSLPP
ncbi:uncharacterized protein TRUGW13939_11178 [Talaromyces rugulosus]|uniref:CENP-T/Histone H4 histone fold domain-containing protein n=1 Tax=Talaromyces rugulosus TaxID=121627 RepID=A0A7H8RER0_TALRU|nr:uncharacterized protein TRUGW13939_11178 [Talaromyces rugulosus]QKX64005.1 hypothetical protein TRUGW13939_11178 [Talaromyces rugulosus]